MLSPKARATALDAWPSMSFAAYSRDDSFPHKAAAFDAYAPQGARTVPNSPSLTHAHHLPPRSYPHYAMNGAFDHAASSSSTGGDLLAPPGAADHHHLVSPLVGHHSQPTSPLAGAHSGAYFTTFDPAPGPSGSGAPHSRQASAETPRLGYHHHHAVAPAIGPAPAPPRAPTPDARAAAAPAPPAPTAAYGSSLKVVQWTPQRGDEGTQVTIILDAMAVRAARPSPVTGQPASFGTGSPALGGPGGSPRKAPGTNRRFAVMFGHAPAPTRFTRAQAIDGNGVGQSMSAGPHEDDAFVVLTAFVPARSAMSAPGDRAMVYVQSVDTDSGAVVEQCIVGEWDPQPIAAGPATPPRVGALKRHGDELVSGREAPGLRSPHAAAAAGSLHGSPARGQGEWNVHGHGPAGDDAPAAHVPAPTPAPGAYPRQPELIRTSQIHAPKNGYGATYSHKVILKLQGDLNTMAMGWSNEEWTNRRRLIQFWPQQDGNVINVGFRPIAQSEYVQNAIVISCIFRDEWNECFVTSVDTIYLLEALVGSRFTVEEKNRIRRNLEGFKPQTVSKSKPDAEPFFKLIMGFPNPKPRNIEKDVKVFPWKVLGPALKKIMSKYSANYPLGPDGAPVALTAVTEPAEDDGSAGGSPATPHLAHAHAQQQQQQQHLAPGPSPRGAHAAVAVSPHLAHTSPHLGGGSPRVGSSSLHAHGHGHGHGHIHGHGHGHGHGHHGHGSAYASTSSSSGASAGAGGYYGVGSTGVGGAAAEGYYSSAPPSQSQSQQGQFGATQDDYGVPASQQQHSYAPGSHGNSSAGGGGASGAAHLRSFSEGVQQYAPAAGVYDQPDAPVPGERWDDERAAAGLANAGPDNDDAREGEP
ncbi:hypothetical protein JCM3770_006362 [Rhodotorula araucariae]